MQGNVVDKYHVYLFWKIVALTSYIGRSATRAYRYAQQSQLL